MELRKPKGYSKSGREMISDDQFSLVIHKVATIIHDRDGRLTDARYGSLINLCIALDDHNAYVKNILFRSWLLCNELQCNTHIDLIKRMIGFNRRMSSQLGFDFEKALDTKKAYFDGHHGDIRQVECPKTGKKTAFEFVNITEVRALFTSKMTALFLKLEPDALLIKALSDLALFSPSQIVNLTKPRRVICEPRFHKSISQPPLLDENLTVSDFLGRYFPEMVSTDNFKYSPKALDALDYKVELPL